MRAKNLSVGICLFTFMFGAFTPLSGQIRERKVSIIPPGAEATAERKENLTPLIIGDVQKSSSRNLAAVPASPKVTPRSVLTDEIRVVTPKAAIQNPPPSIQNKVENREDNDAISLSAFEQRLFQAMQNRLGTRYVYGSEGPTSYDCSGLVWRVFQEAGYDFGRASAASYWRQFQPVSGDERYEFGTLVFFNRLSHVGIVIDENGFYHASQSKGVTYSPFKGYWEKRIVGFRRVPVGD